MSALSDKLAAKKFPSKDVTICLDAGLSAERESASEELVAAERGLRAAARTVEEGVGDTRLAANPVKAAEKKVAAAETGVQHVEDRMRPVSVTIRFTAVPFGEWNKFIIQNPPRKGKDEVFNPSTFWLHAARRTGKYVTDSGEVEDISKEEWDELEASLTDAEHDRLAATLYSINKAETRGINFLSSSSEKTLTFSEN